MNNPKILFAGTAEIAVPLLKALSKKFCVVGVLTNCDKSVGRSKALVPTPVKQAALELGLEVLQFDSLKSEARQKVRELKADVLVSFAYGKIFGPMFLNLFSKGCFNVHPSRLPQLRGPSPIQSTILEGLNKCTISLQNIGLKMDEGAIWGTSEFSLDGTETTESLTSKVAEQASSFVPNLLSDIFENKIQSVEQLGEPTYCHMVEKEDGKLDFKKTAKKLHCQIRACYPWPKAWARVNNLDIAITGVWGNFEEISFAEDCSNIEPGRVVSYRKDRGLAIACSDKILWVTRLQLASKKELDYKAFVNGNRWILESKFE